MRGQWTINAVPRLPGTSAEPYSFISFQLLPENLEGGVRGPMLQKRHGRPPVFLDPPSISS
jgi:hypothetical protein